MKFMADLMCNFIRQRAETDAGQGHALSVFIKFFRFQLGVAGIPDKEEAVSYTHLDVYKRQEFCRGQMSGQNSLAL